MDTPSTYLSNILAEIGPESCDRHMFLDILQQVASRLTKSGLESQVANSIAMMCYPFPQGTSANLWNLQSFGSACLEVFPKLDLGQVLANLEHTKVEITDVSSAAQLIGGLRAMTKNFSETFLMETLLKRWTDVGKQLKFLFHLLLLPADVLNFSQFKGRKVISSADDSGLSQSGISIVSSLESSTWNCLAIYEFIASLIDSEYFEQAKPIFELASRQSPELLCIALASIDPPWNSINKEILVKLCCGFIVGQQTSQIVLPRVWHLNPNVLLFCMVEMYRRDRNCLSRLLDVAQELKILPVMLEAKPLAFALELACLASRRQILNLEKWIGDMLSQKGDVFVKESVLFLHQKHLSKGEDDSSASSLTPDIYNSFLNRLSSVFHAMPKEIAEKFREVHSFVYGRAINPPTINSPPNDPSMNLPESIFNPDVEEEVNSLFDKIFVRELGIPDAISILRKLKDSTSVRDQQVLNCFLHNLFDEYRFFNKYPDSELSLTAVLFGQIINCGLLSSSPLQVALRCILEALKKPTGQKLFKFGLQALAQFHTHLPEWPQFCSQLIQLNHLQQHYPDLFAYIGSAIAGKADTMSSDQKTLGLKGTDENVGGESFGTGNPLAEIAERHKLPMPSDSIRDKILFILNNLALSNMESKANDLVKILEEPHFAWLAQYLVVRRASIEPNYHKLYLAFLDVLQVRTLEQQILNQTYSNIYILLGSPRIHSSISERTLLKNLGSWLGGLTLARSIPILYRHICLKDLLMEAFDQGRLIYILPFVCKVAEQAASSIAFQPDNPWLMAILRLLAELYNYADLKLNLKFEIEVLCKNLSIDLPLLAPSNMLKKRGALLAAMGMGPPTKAAPPAADSRESMCSSFVVLGSKLPATLKSTATLTKIIGFSIEYSLRDLGLKAIQNSIQHALTTVKVLVTNDLSGESDMKVVFENALKMAVGITVNSVSMLTRESTKLSIANYMRLFAQWSGIPLSSDHVDFIADDNIQIAILLLEKLAYEASVSYFQNTLVDELSSVRKSGVAPRSVDSVRNVGKIYEEYFQLARTSQLEGLPSISLEPVSEDELARLSSMLAQKQSKSTALDQSQSSPAAEIMSPGLPAADMNLDMYFETVCTKFIDLVSVIEKLVSDMQIKFDSVSQLPSSHEIRSIMKQIILLASSSPIHRDELCLLMSQRLLQSLYRTNSALSVDIIILLLIKIFEFSGKAAKEVTSWVIHSTDERKYSVLATVALFGSGLIYVLDFDGQLAKQIEAGGNEVVVTFAVSLVRHCIFGDKPVAAPYDFVFTLEALGKYLNAAFADENTSAAKSTTLRMEISSLLKEIGAIVKSPQPESQLLRDQITFCFTDWFRLCQYPSISEKLISSFVGQLFQRKFMVDEESARPFFQICTEMSIELYVRQRRAPAILAYRSIDAFARLLGQILRLHPGTSSDLTSLDALRIITIAHSVIGMVFVQGQEQGVHYLQRPLSRLFSSICGEILRLDEAVLGVDSITVLENLSSFYMLISPHNYPEFAFGWLELVINRHILPRLLSAGTKGWNILLQLLLEYLEFCNPLLSDIDGSEATRALYRGLIRSFLMILHDCSDFLVAYGRVLVAAIPLGAIQLRNVILASLPSNYGNLPDPLTTTIKSVYTKEKSDVQSWDESFRCLPAEVRTCISNRDIDPLSFCALWKSINSDRHRDLALYHVELADLAVLSEGQEFMSAIKSTTIYQVLTNILADGDVGRTFTAIAAAVNGLLYPSNLAYLNYSLLLVIFVESTITVKEIITRALLERLIVHRPHPWGVMVTLIELVRNSKYRFWDFPFTRITPEIERVFDAISKSCLKEN